MKHIFILCLFLISVTFLSLKLTNSTPLTNTKSVDLIKISPPYLQVYHAVNKYAPKYNIPTGNAFRTARLESGYRGPKQIDYNPAQTSSGNAEGPFQFILSTARYVSGDKNLSRHEIRNNIELNTKLSMKYQRQLKNTYKNWAVVYGYYNTGYPVVNGYANKIVRKNSL